MIRTENDHLMSIFLGNLSRHLEIDHTLDSKDREKLTVDHTLDS